MTAFKYISPTIVRLKQSAVIRRVGVSQPAWAKPLESVGKGEPESATCEAEAEAEAVMSESWLLSHYATGGYIEKAKNTFSEQCSPINLHIN